MAIQFDEDNFGSPSASFANAGMSGQNSGSKMVDFLISKGLVKDAASANAILVIVSLICIALSIYFFVYGFNLPQGQTQVTPTPYIGTEQPLENQY